MSIRVIMKVLKSVFILLAILFVSSKTCHGRSKGRSKDRSFGFYLKKAGALVDIFLQGQSIYALFIDEDAEARGQRNMLNQKLDEVYSVVQRVEKHLDENFKALLAKIDETASKTTSFLVANMLENAIIRMGYQLEEIVHTAKKVKKGLFNEKDDLVKSDLETLSSNIRNYKDEIRAILDEKSYSLDFFLHVKDNVTNVCRDGMSQLQALDTFRVLYVDTMTKFLISRHLIISMFELLGTPDTNNQKKITANEIAQKNLDQDLTRFQEVMSSASREFQTCNKPSVLHETGARYLKTSSCYIIDPNDKYQPSSGTITSLIVQPSLDSITSSDADEPICVYYFSLRPANAKPGYVVLGAKIQSKLNVLYVRVLQGKLLPTGSIDPKSISYSDEPEDVTGDPVVKIWYRDTVIDMTETVVPDNRVITGLRFAQSNKGHVYLEVTSTEINLKEGLLDEKTSRPENHQDGITPYKIRNPSTKKNKVVRYHTGLQPVEPKQHVKLSFYFNHGAHPYIDGDVIFPIPLTLLSGASLYVKEVEGELGFISIRFNTFNIVPHLKITLDPNQNFTDILNRI